MSKRTDSPCDFADLVALAERMAPESRNSALFWIWGKRFEDAADLLDLTERVYSMLDHRNPDGSFSVPTADDEEEFLKLRASLGSEVSKDEVLRGNWDCGVDALPSCPACDGYDVGYWGSDAAGKQRYVCKSSSCSTRTFTVTASRASRLGEGKEALCLAILREGVSIRGVERITGVHRDTISKLRQKALRTTASG